MLNEAGGRGSGLSPSFVRPPMVWTASRGGQRDRALWRSVYTLRSTLQFSGTVILGLSQGSLIRPVWRSSVRLHLDEWERRGRSRASGSPVPL